MLIWDSVTDFPRTSAGPYKLYFANRGSDSELFENLDTGNNR